MLDLRTDTSNNENRTIENHALKGHITLKNLVSPSRAGNEI